MTNYQGTQPIAALLTIEPNGPHDHVPHGAPAGADWWTKGVTHNGNNSAGYFYTNPYGQLYTIAEGNTQTDALVEVRDMQEWFLNSHGVWTAAYPSPPLLGGALYTEIFDGKSKPGNLDTASIPGSIVISPAAGYLFHVYPGIARAAIPQPADIQGVVVAARARLVDGTYALDVEPPGLIFDVGADYWTTPNAGVEGNAGVGQSRFKLVTREWRAYVYSTLTTAQIAAIQQGTMTPPPIPFDVSELF